MQLRKCLNHIIILWYETLLSGQRLIPAMMVVGIPPVGEGEEMVGEIVVCGVDERIAVMVNVGMIVVLLDDAG